MQKTNNQCSIDSYDDGADLLRIIFTILILGSDNCYDDGILTMPAATLTPVAAVGSHRHNANRDSASLAAALPAQACSRPTSCTSAGEPGK